jgi:ABC-type Fe3+ transport system permease subunit
MLNAQKQWRTGKRTQAVGRSPWKLTAKAAAAAAVVVVVVVVEVAMLYRSGLKCYNPRQGGPEDPPVEDDTDRRTQFRELSKRLSLCCWNYDQR